MKNVFVFVFRPCNYLGISKVIFLALTGPEVIIKNNKLLYFIYLFENRDVRTIWGVRTNSAPEWITAPRISYADHKSESMSPYRGALIFSCGANGAGG